MENKKYKLIKDYPGCIFKIGDHLIINPSTSRIHPENYPEFWEEIIEKDYEILSWLTGSGKLEFSTTITPHSEFKPLFDKIQSVKRLSDGEIFTIGDDIIEQCEHSKIEYFEVRGDDLVLRINHQVTKGSSTILICSNFKKRLTPLFTTEDGVDIFEGDEFYYVKFKPNRKSYGNIDQIIHANTSNCKYEPQYEKYFSTKEKAEEYILMNKPCLSLQDIKNLYLEGLKDLNEGFLFKLKELVKNK